MRKLLLLILVQLILITVSNGQGLMSLIPTNTATHVATSSGNWFSPTTWDTGTIPEYGSIVHIPQNISVEYDAKSNAHIFAIRVDGEFKMLPASSGDSTILIVDTYVGVMTSNTEIISDASNTKKIDILFSAFDIEGYKLEANSNWNPDARNHFVDGQPVYKIERLFNGKKRYNTFSDAIAGNNSVTSTPIETIYDGSGVLGRYSWDPGQLSLGMITMGTITIKGVSKTTKIKLSADAVEKQKTIQLESVPSNWFPGDTIIVTMDGNYNTENRGEDEAVISAINGTTITTEKNLKKNHIGRQQDNLHCYVGNLDRNVTFRSSSKKPSRRAHFMAMHNDAHIEVSNAVFKDMGRTNKSEVLDDEIWSNWLAPKTFHSKVSPLGQEIAELEKNPANEVTNMRGRYSIHLHRIGVEATTNMAEVTGNVVWGNIGWGITQHHSLANISDNVVYEVTGSAIVSESGSELGFWNNNLVVNVSKGHILDVYTAAIIYDDYLFSGQGLGMRGRGVMCDGNVISNANFGVGIHNMNPVKTNTDRVNALALATLRPGFEFDQFPLDANGYSSEGDGIIPTELSLILKNTETVWCNQGLRSIERDMGVNHESRSIFDKFTVWGAKQCLSITYQADYSFKDVFLSGKDPLDSKGMYIWKHSHNHVFDGIKMVDLKYAMTVSKLVESGNGVLKTRNNGFTPWFFLDFELENVGKMYQIILEDETSTIPYTEHGDNPIHMSHADFLPRETTFTILDSSIMEVDVAAGDLMFMVDGIVTDQLGSYHFGIKQAPAQGDLRLAYPERVYEFASQQKFEEYLSANGVYKYEGTDQLYFIINEIVPDRLTWEYTSFPMRINIMNPPSTGVFANPSIESEENFEPVNHLISRTALVSQSSTQQGIVYRDSVIDASAYKSIDGSNNGRIGVNFYQDGLVPIGSFSQTEIETEPWYDLDLGKNHLISHIDIWNTVEINGYSKELNSSHFKNFYILISDQPFTGMDLSTAMSNANYVYFKDDSDTKRKFSLDNIMAEGQFVRIQAMGTNMLKFAEVEIIGKEYVSDCTLVTSTADSGEGSLRAAIECALSGDTIRFDTSLNNDTVQVNSTKLSIDKDLVILADMSQNIVVENVMTSSTIEQTFEITSDGNMVKLSGFTIATAGDLEGVVIRNSGNLFLENMTLHMNELNLESALYNHTNATITISENVILKNDY